MGLAIMTDAVALILLFGDLQSKALRNCYFCCLIPAIA